MRDPRPLVLTLGALTLVALAALLAVPAAAQTPDGLPPALETVCDAESGAAFGWCNAYCEAMDCELANDDDPLSEPNASAAACGKVRTKFQQLTGRDMPCEVSCPCTDNPHVFPVWAAYLAGDVSADFCQQDGAFCQINFNLPPYLCSPPLGDITYIFFFNGDQIGASSLGLPALGRDFPLCGDSTGGLIPLTSAQGALCKEQLDAVLAASGLICDQPPV